VPPYDELEVGFAANDMEKVDLPPVFDAVIV
jgi:hypothetical protein